MHWVVFIMQCVENQFGLLIGGSHLFCVPCTIPGVSHTAIMCHPVKKLFFYAFGSVWESMHAEPAIKTKEQAWKNNYGWSPHYPGKTYYLHPRILSKAIIAWVEWLGDSINRSSDEGGIILHKKILRLIPILSKALFGNSQLNTTAKSIIMHPQSWSAF